MQNREEPASGIGNVKLQRALRTLDLLSLAAHFSAGEHESFLLFFKEYRREVTIKTREAKKKTLSAETISVKQLSQKTTCVK